VNAPPPAPAPASAAPGSARRRDPRFDRVLAIAQVSLLEALRRRLVGVIGLLTLAFLALYAVGVGYTFSQIEQGGLTPAGSVVEEQALAGGTLLGLAMFTTLFLGALVGVFLSMSAVRGDAEQGLLQPLAVRPLSRGELLAGRFGAAAAGAAAYAGAVYVVAVLITGLLGGWWPDRLLTPGLALVVGQLVIVALATVASIRLSAMATGIGTLMAVGAGLAAGLLGQIGEALSQDTLRSVSETVAWALPFEALYQAGLAGLNADASGFTELAINLGPFGGAEPAGPLLWVWALAYIAGCVAIAARLLGRTDL
jgi:Cu-processing system permease protein